MLCLQIKTCPICEIHLAAFFLGHRCRRSLTFRSHISPCAEPHTMHADGARTIGGGVGGLAGARSSSESHPSCRSTSDTAPDSLSSGSCTSVSGAWWRSLRVACRTVKRYLFCMRRAPRVSVSGLTGSLRVRSTYLQCVLVERSYIFWRSAVETCAGVGVGRGERGREIFFVLADAPARPFCLWRGSVRASPRLRCRPEVDYV